jgi:hypothetical protein
MMRMFLALTVVISCTVSAQSALAAIIITEVMSQSLHGGGTNNADWFEVTNNGATAVDITGWSWDDDSFQPGTATFGAITSIAAGQSIIVTGETVGAEGDWRINWALPDSIPIVNLGNGVPGLSAAGDEIYIFDAQDIEIAHVRFGPATTGSTFYWDNQGNDLGISQNGVDGAYQAAFNGAAGPGLDVGSPGLAVIAAVPEPSTLAVLGTIGVAAVVRKRWRKKA